MRESSTYNTKKNTVVTRKHKKEIRLCCYATRRGALPEEASIHTAEMTATKESGHKMDNIYRLVQLSAGHREQQRKLSNTKSDV